MPAPKNAAEGGLPATTSTVAAFFDLDKTVIATSSALAFGKEFMSHGLITPVEALEMSWTRTTYMLAGQSSTQMDATRDQLAAMVAGWDVAQVRSIAEETLHTVVMPSVYAEALELIRFHHQAGHDVIIVSASAADLVRPIAAALGVDDIVATTLETADGKYTGRILFYNKGEAKAEAIRALAARHNYDLAHCYAYSDSATDLPMLTAVGNPVAVNPDRALKKQALARGWDIRTFRDPQPLFGAPTAKEVGIGTGVVVGLAAMAMGGLWWSRRAGGQAG